MQMPHHSCFSSETALSDCGIILHLKGSGELFAPTGEPRSRKITQSRKRDRADGWSAGELTNEEHGLT